jgi:hypothetical protein
MSTVPEPLRRYAAVKPEPEPRVIELLAGAVDRMLLPLQSL